MIIKLTRTGGFTGIALKKTIDTKTLTPEKAKEIEQLVQSSTSKVEESKSANLNPKAQPDRFIYTISIQNEAISQNLTVDEKSMPQSTHDLIKYIESI